MLASNVALVLAGQKPQPDSLFRKRLALPVDMLTRSRSNLVSLGVAKDYAVCTSLDGGKCFPEASRGKSEGDLDLTVQWQHVADLQISETNQDLVDLVLGAFGDSSQSDDFQVAPPPSRRRALSPLTDGSRLPPRRFRLARTRS